MKDCKSEINKHLQDLREAGEVICQSHERLTKIARNSIRLNLALSVLAALEAVAVLYFIGATGI